MPSGILREKTRCVIGNGVVLDPATLEKEINGLKAAGHMGDDGRLLISGRAT